MMSGPFTGGRRLQAVIIAGVVGEIALELISWVIAPALLGRPMQPAILVDDLVRALFGLALPMSAAIAVHLVSGLVIFPIGYLIFRAATGITSPIISGVLWGAVLWIIAQAILAPLAGRPFMLGFIAYTWASLGAHIVYALTIALIYQRLSRSVAPSR